MPTMMARIARSSSGCGGVGSGLVVRLAEAQGNAKPACARQPCADPRIGLTSALPLKQVPEAKMRWQSLQHRFRLTGEIGASPASTSLKGGCRLRLSRSVPYGHTPAVRRGGDVSPYEEAEQQPVRDEEQRHEDS